ncbi:hypothetical protein CASFOL_017558 [Castilleja foliolosa]|uniref:S-protein homolog n=1 Tax=Castilleja foliolosa TaxID=1961234 RepID=A0ABD3D867_9LAMI
MGMNMWRFLVISIVLFQPFTLSTAICFIESPYYVFVKDALPQGSPPLYMHCASGDTELGNHTLYTGQDFHFHFCPIEYTLFFCHLWWNGKERAFEVFNNHKWKYPKCPDKKCDWEARNDGIYLTNKKEYDWHNI